MSTRGVLRACRRGATILIQAEGTVTMTDAPPLRSQVEGWLADGATAMQVDLARCAYLDSTKLVPNLERLPDKVHPSKAGRARWAKAVITWLDEHPLGDVEPRWVSLEP